MLVSSHGCAKVNLLKITEAQNKLYDILNELRETHVRRHEA